MKSYNETLKDMPCVIVFDPNVSQEENDNRWFKWYARTESAVQDKAVPNAAETRKMLHAK